MSDFRFYCIRCGEHLVVDSSAAGQSVKCPACSALVTVPLHVAVPPPPIVPSPPSPVSDARALTGGKQGMAITSLVLGIISVVSLGLGFLTGIPAIILGHLARSRASKLPHLHSGKGKATVGLVMGYWSVAAFLLLFLPAYFHLLDREASIRCQNNMKIIGLSLRQWALDNRDAYPFNVASKDGGSKEWCAPANDGYDKNSVRHFQVMSNELSSPKVLICPSDKSKLSARSFPELVVTNVTYLLRVGAEVNDANPQEILARCPVHGHLILCDGSVLTGVAAKNYRPPRTTGSPPPQIETKIETKSELKAVEAEAKAQVTDTPITTQQARVVGLWIPAGCTIDIGGDGTIHPHETGVIAKDRDGNPYESRQIPNHSEKKNGFFRKPENSTASPGTENNGSNQRQEPDGAFPAAADAGKSEPVPPTRAVQPGFAQPMPEGPNTMTVFNKLNTAVGVGVFSRKSGSTYQYGIIRGVVAGGSVTIGVPNGRFDVYWIRQDKPYSRFRNPTPFNITGGNTKVGKLLTATIGSAEGDTPVEETF